MDNMEIMLRYLGRQVLKSVQTTPTPSVAACSISWEFASLLYGDYTGHANARPRRRCSQAQAQITRAHLPRFRLQRMGRWMGQG